MSPQKTYEEINSYVVFWGLFFSVLFALAVGYLCLKIGQTVDAFAPVSVLAMGMAVLFHRKNAFPETVHIQAIASAGTNIIGGAMFILPALYILNIEDVSFIEMAIPIVLGGVLGVFLATVFRRYFCEEMDGVYPFPSGSAAAEVLESDEGTKAHLMLLSGAVALVYDFVLNSLGWWQELLTTTTFHWGQVLADKYKLVFSLDNDAALLGIGYFTGLRYAAIIAAGSFFSWLVCIPVAYYLGGDHTMVVGGETMLLANAPVDAVFSQYVRHIGIGMLAMSGIIGLLSMSGVVVRVVKRAIADLFSKGSAATGTLLRTQQDLPMTQIVFGSLLMAILFAVFFHVMCSESLMQTVIAFVLVVLFALMLSVVGISSIAFTGNEPVSGMTIFMIIVSAVVMGGVGMSGKTGIIAILMMAAFLCATLAVSGNFMSELKVAYITGATPKKMQQWQLVSIVLAAIGIVLMTYQLGKLPWVAVVLAVSFSVYGALKKQLHLNPFSSITLETLLMVPFAVPYIGILMMSPANHFSLATPDLALYLMGTGVVTAVPLVLFSYGANLLPLNVLGFFQYISPTIGLLLGIFFFHETFGMAQISALGFVWAAIVLFTVAESLRGR